MSTPINILCSYCGGIADERSTCPKSLPCRECNAKPGRRCKRPSGHAAMNLHASRIADAERRDIEANLPWTRTVATQLTMDQEGAAS